MSPDFAEAPAAPRGPDDSNAASSEAPPVEPSRGSRWHQLGLWLRPDVQFLLAGVLAGAGMLSLNPPLQSPDEIEHFIRSYHVSEGHWLPEQVGIWGGVTIPRSLMLLRTQTQTLWGHPDRKYTSEMQRAVSQLPLEPAVRSTQACPSTALYSAVPYLPSAAGIRLGRLLDASPLQLLYWSRTVNLLAYLVLTWWAMRITPAYSRVFLLAGAMPMSLYLAGSVSADGVTTGVVFVAVAWILRLANGRLHTVPPLEAACVVALLAVVGLCKSVYVGLPLLIGLIPSRRCGGVTRKLVFLAAGVAASLGACVAWSWQSKDFWPDPRPLRPPLYISRSAQVQEMQQHPGRFLTACLNSVRRYGHVYRDSLVGLFGMLDTPLRPHWLLKLYPLAALAILCASREPRARSQFGQSVLSSAVLAASVGLIFLGLYVAYTEVGAEIVEGFQGRYLIPLLVLAPLVLSIPGKRRTWQLPGAQVNLASALLLGLMLGCAILTLDSRFYAAASVP